MAFFQCGEVRLLLGGPEGDAGPAVSPLVYFRRTGSDAARRLARGRPRVRPGVPHLQG
jgi:hypothetical protein